MSTRILLSGGYVIEATQPEFERHVDIEILNEVGETVYKGHVLVMETKRDPRVLLGTD